MKCLVVVLAVIAAPLAAQQNMAQQAVDLFRDIYFRQVVQDGCRRGAKFVTVQIDGPGSAFDADCQAMRDFLEQRFELYRLATKCDAESVPTVTVRAFGRELQVNCFERAEDLPRIEAWMARR